MQHLASCDERRLVRPMIFCRRSGIAAAEAVPPSAEHFPAEFATFSELA